MTRAPDSGLEVWVGKAEMLAMPGSDTLGGAKGAFATVLAWATDRASFLERVRIFCVDLEVVLVDVEHAELYADRLQRGEVSDELAAAADDLDSNAESIRYTTFHTWREADA